MNSFHRFAIKFIEETSQSIGRDLLKETEHEFPGSNKYEFQIPQAFARAVEKSDSRYDAIIIDEGQDFKDEYWLPLEILLRNYEKSPFYIFFDGNQSIYKLSKEFPFETENIFPLTINCRNTKPIHSTAYNYYSGVPVDPPEIQGVEIAIHGVNEINKQVNAINQLLIKLIIDNKINPEDIAILILDNRSKASYENLLTKLPLPGKSAWLSNSYPDEGEIKGKIRIDSVHRFKGLEIPIVILWDFNNIIIEDHREVLYVGLSRAKSELHIVGPSDLCREILE